MIEPCNLPLAGLDAAETCPRCGYLASNHRRHRSFVAPLETVIGVDLATGPDRTEIFEVDISSPTATVTLPPGTPHSSGYVHATTPPGPRHARVVGYDIKPLPLSRLDVERLQRPAGVALEQPDPEKRPTLDLAERCRYLARLVDFGTAILDIPIEHAIELVERAAKAERELAEAKRGAADLMAHGATVARHLAETITERDAALRELAEANRQRSNYLAAIRAMEPDGRMFSLTLSADGPGANVPMYGQVSLVSCPIVSDEENDDGSRDVHVWTYDEDVQHEPEMMSVGYFVDEEWLCDRHEEMDELAAERDAARQERDALRDALALAEVDVALERSWCRVCRTECRGEYRGRKEHRHAPGCLLFGPTKEGA